MAETHFAQSDAYLSALIREVRSVPPAGVSPTMGRRTFFKLAGAGAAGLVLGFHLGGAAFAAEMANVDTADGKDQTMNAFIRMKAFIVWSLPSAVSLRTTRSPSIPNARRSAKASRPPSA
jgi:hypothetical protein